MGKLEEGKRVQVESPVDPEFFMAGDEEMFTLLEAEPKFRSSLRFDLYGEKHILAYLFSTHLARLVWNLDRKVGHFLLFLNFFGNIFILLSLTGVVSRSIVVPCALLSFPLVMQVLLNGNLTLLIMMTHTFEFWFLNCQMLAYCIVMVDLFQYDERSIAVILWFFGFMCFNTLDACYAPREKPHMAMIFSCVYSFALWLVFIVLMLSGVMKNLFPREVLFTVSNDLEINFNTATFAVAATCRRR